MNIIYNLEEDKTLYVDNSLDEDEIYDEYQEYQLSQIDLEKLTNVEYSANEYLPFN